LTTTYQSGRRIQTTSAEFGTNGSGASAVSGGWKELGRTTLGSTADIITVSSLADKRYLMCLFDSQNSGGVANLTRLGAGSVDSGSNYAYRPSSNGGADSTSTSVSYMNLLFQDGSYDAFGVQYIANLASKEKLLIEHGVRQQAAGTSTAPGRNEAVGKWVNTSSALDTVSHYNIDTGSYNTGTEVVVLGWDDSDTHTSNFWEELATNSTVSSDKIDVSFTAKKYLWVQGYYKQGAGTSGSVRLRVGNTTVDTGSNYTERYEQDGGADATLTSQSELYKTITTGSGAVGLLGYINMFIINNAANEKLIISNVIENNSAGAGTAPRRLQTVAKWANTSNQIDIISLYRNSETLDSGNLTVWGSN
tara:strand:+ start:99 stop:1187 length:1089 start_codon:yes stop_codon:yes gene_type:complete